MPGVGHGRAAATSRSAGRRASAVPRWLDWAPGWTAWAWAAGAWAVRDGRRQPGRAWPGRAPGRPRAGQSRAAHRRGGRHRRRGRPTGLDELDRVLGGGLVPGAVVLLAGEPGVASPHCCWRREPAPAEAGPVLYITRRGIRRAGPAAGGPDRRPWPGNLYLAAETDLATLLGHVAVVRPQLLIVDSVQTITMEGVDGAPGGVSQIRAVTAALIAVAKQHAVTTVLVGHVTKDGSIAGPRALEHLVDVVLHFEGDRHAQFRMVRALKNRYGPTDELGCFDLGEQGITELPTRAASSSPTGATRCPAPA